MPNRAARRRPPRNAVNDNPRRRARATGRYSEETDSEGSPASDDMDDPDVDDLFLDIDFDVDDIMARYDQPPRAGPVPAARHRPERVREPTTDEEDEDRDEDDDGIEVLEEAPAHLRPAPPAVPIEVLDSSDEDEDAETAQPRRHRLKRRPSDSFEIIDTPSPKRQQVAAPEAQDQAGPLNETILPKADYLVPVVLEVIPDLCKEWTRTNLERIMEALKGQSNVPGQDAIDQVINLALEMEEYPRAKEAEKAAPEEVEQGDYKDPGYRALEREGRAYEQLALSTLETLFTGIPVGHIRDAFKTVGRRRLVPAYTALHAQTMMADKPYKALKKPRQVKGRARVDPNDELDDDDAARADIPSDAEFYREYRFLKALMSEAAQKERLGMEEAEVKEKEEAARAKRREEAIALGRSKECGCCFDQEALEDMVCCPEGHLFCRQCVVSFAESKLGEQKTDITCMDMSGCQELFTEGVLSGIIGASAMSLYHRLRQMKDLEMAGIDGLENCPHCPFAVVIDNPNEKLFRCLNPECRKVTCRKCKRPDHIPMRCEEVEEAFKLNNRHAVEEAMSAALMRRCPKCAKPYLKESGCNKITCQNCRTVSCYICQKEIPEGYGHFDQFPGRRGTDITKCHLWDRANEGDAEAERIRNARDEARQKAIAEAAAKGQELDEADIDVEAPAAVPPAQPMGYPMYAPLPLGYHDFLLRRLPQDQAAAAGARARAAIEAFRQGQAAQAEARRQVARAEALAGHERHLENAILDFGRVLDAPDNVFRQRLNEHLMRNLGAPVAPPLNLANLHHAQQHLQAHRAQLLQGLHRPPVHRGAVAVPAPHAPVQVAPARPANIAPPAVAAPGGAAAAAPQRPAGRLRVDDLRALPMAELAGIGHGAGRRGGGDPDILNRPYDAGRNRNVLPAPRPPVQRGLGAPPGRARDRHNDLLADLDPFRDLAEPRPPPQVAERYLRGGFEIIQAPNDGAGGVGRRGRGRPLAVPDRHALLGAGGSRVRGADAPLPAPPA